ncbi:MAG: hypothetical protein PVG93_05240 [Phycisphaerales bacterium]|jgi:hypothetical protein
MKNALQSYLQPAFLLCIIVLGMGSLGMSFIESYFRLWLEKEPIPLKKSLDLLDEQKLKSFKVLDKYEIENKEILKSLGTEDYIQWIVFDTEAPEDSTAKKCMVFITYYDKPDAVPHVPEECYTGGGFRKQSSDPITFNVVRTMGSDGISTQLATEKTQQIPGRYVVFGRESTSIWQPRAEFPVLYFFNANGAYVNSRTEARIALAKNIRSKHSYFSKVEIVFNQNNEAPTMKDAIKLSEKLLAVILPILETEHWPDITNG